VRAAAHNGLGDYYREKGQVEEAFWHYLRVDVLYSQDLEEQARALYWLSKLYEKKAFEGRAGDPERAKNCRDRLLDARFAKTEFQALAAKEK